jgi:hypothetical protein
VACLRLEAMFERIQTQLQSFAIQCCVSYNCLILGSAGMTSCPIYQAGRPEAFDLLGVLIRCRECRFERYNV